MIEVMKVNKAYLECMTCESTYDVYFLTFQHYGANSESSIKLCKRCRNELKAQIEMMDGEVDC